MLSKPVNWRRPRLSAGRCPVCGWWFDGLAVGAGEPTGDTAPIVEWAFDAARQGRCNRRACYVANNFDWPILEYPRPSDRRSAGSRQAGRETPGPQVGEGRPPRRSGRVARACPA